MNPRDVRWPDFILIGAQKSGTSSLHYILAQHPRVFMPDGEVFFFDVDDREQHPDFFPARLGVEHDLDRDFARYAAWYDAMLRPAGDRLAGEDSTTYLASKRAPERVERWAPEARLIAMLRDPVQRAWSHYWHLVRSGRATLPFERLVEERPGNLLRRGFYREQLERWRPALDAGRLRVFLFEDFVRDPQRVVDAACAHIGLADTVDVSTVETHRNKATPPISLPLRLALNRIRAPFEPYRYNRRVPGMPGYRPGRGRPDASHPVTRAWEWLQEATSPKRYPPMTLDARARLETLYRRENDGLDALLGVDLAAVWPWWPS